MVLSARRRGVFLVDILVATVVLGAAFAIMMGMASLASRAQRDGEHLSNAAMLLDEQLQLVVARGADQYASRFPTSGACEAPFADYSYELEIGDAVAGQAYPVIATVSWSEGGRVRSVSCETLVAPRPGDQPDPERRPPTAIERYAP